MKTVQEIVDLLNEQQLGLYRHEVYDNSDVYKPGRGCWVRHEAIEVTENGKTDEVQCLFDRNEGRIAAYVNGKVDYTLGDTIAIDNYVIVRPNAFGTEKCIFKQVDSLAK